MVFSRTGGMHTGIDSAGVTGLDFLEREAQLAANIWGTSGFCCHYPVHTLISALKRIPRRLLLPVLNPVVCQSAIVLDHFVPNEVPACF